MARNRPLWISLLLKTLQSGGQFLPHADSTLRFSLLTFTLAFFDACNYLEQL